MTNPPSKAKNAELTAQQEQWLTWSSWRSSRSQIPLLTKVDSTVVAWGISAGGGRSTSVHKQLSGGWLR